MRINHHTNIKIAPLVLALSMTVIGCSSIALLGDHASAAPFTQAYVRLDTLKAATVTGGRVCAKVVSTVPVEASVQVTFPTTVATDFIVNPTNTNWPVNTTNLEATQTPWPGIGTSATVVSGKTVTFSSTDLLSTSALYCFNFTGGLTTSSALAAETISGNILTRTSAPANIDQTNYDFSIISNDQIIVNATVPPSFAFVLNGNTDAFATNLSTAAVNTSNQARTVTITTNAASGWIVWVKSLTANAVVGKGALASATASYKIAGNVVVGTSHLFTAGVENYGLATTIATDAASGGVVSLNPNYDGTTTSFAGTLDPALFQPVASANGTANGDVINLKELVTIAGQTPAASDYTDTLSVIGAGVY